MLCGARRLPCLARLARLPLPLLRRTALPPHPPPPPPLPPARALSTAGPGAGAGQTEHAQFEHICSETLESLCELLEEVVQRAPHLLGADVQYADGVLTVHFGAPYGTYVINRQTPNKQIWLSSPSSGPKRYDLNLDNGGHWIYKHDGVSLHQLLQREISLIVCSPVDFSKCAYSLV